MAQGGGIPGQSIERHALAPTGGCLLGSFALSNFEPRANRCKPFQRLPTSSRQQGRTFSDFSRYRPEWGMGMAVSWGSGPTPPKSLLRLSDTRGGDSPTVC